MGLWRTLSASAEKGGFEPNLMDATLEYANSSPLHQGREACCAKASRRHGSTMVATINRRLMLGDLQARRGQVEHLTPLHPLRHPRRQGAVTRAAMRRLMPFDKIGCRRLAQGVAPVANLAAAFLVGLATQAARCWLLQAITRRGLAAIVAVLGQRGPEGQRPSCPSTRRRWRPAL